MGNSATTWQPSALEWQDCTTMPTPKLACCLAHCYSARAGVPVRVCAQPCVSSCAALCVQPGGQVACFILVLAVSVLGCDTGSAHPSQREYFTQSVTTCILQKQVAGLCTVLIHKSPFMYGHTVTYTRCTMWSDLQAA